MFKRLLLIFLCCFSTISSPHMTLDTVWGPFEIDDELLEELIESDVMQRLKEVDQSGPVVYFNLCPKFTRFDHSVGVLALLIKAGVSHVEQVAGLLHDASHTAYSHLGDFLFHEGNDTTSYQDLIHLDFLKHMGVDKIVEKYGYTLDQLDPDLEEYVALERPRPDLCADRIQYFLNTGVVFEAITSQEAKEIVDDLLFEDGLWFFQSPALARKFAMMSIHFNKYLYNVGWNCALYHFFEQVLRRAAEIELIHTDDICYGTDEAILERLYASQDETIQKLLLKCWNVFDCYQVVPLNKGDKNLRLKFWGVNPFIKINDQLVRLTEIDHQFKHDYDVSKTWTAYSYGIKFF